MMSSSPSDEALVTAVRNGDLGAFDALYSRWERRLFGYIRRQVQTHEEAEDLFQEVFLRVLRDRSYDPHRGRFAPWLFTAARNRCTDHKRSRGRDEVGREAMAADPATSAAPARQSAEPRDVLEAETVRAAVGALPTGQRNLLLLKQVGDLTYREIAELEGIPEGTVKSRLHQAVHAFRRALGRLTPTGERS